MGREYGTWEKDGTEFGEHNIVYLATLQEIRMGYARFGVRINQINQIKSKPPRAADILVHRTLFGLDELPCFGVGRVSRFVKLMTRMTMAERLGAVARLCGSSIDSGGRSSERLYEEHRVLTFG